MQVILESERLLFRPHLITDVDDYCAMEMDSEVRRYVGGYPRSREDAEKRFPKNQAEKMGTDRLALWATIFKAENTYVGRCGLVPHFKADGKPIPGEAAMGFYIAHKYWGRGFASEAGRAFIDFGLKELGLTRIAASLEEGNDASLHVLQKLDFTIVNIEKGPRTFYHLVLQHSAHRSN
jgi:ribosomal-protein-alanine N-acetyltransferase